VNKASHSFSASALPARELCKNHPPLGMVLQKGAGRLEPERTTITPNIAYTVGVQAVEKGDSNAK